MITLAYLRLPWPQPACCLRHCRAARKRDTRAMQGWLSLRTHSTTSCGGELSRRREFSGSRALVLRVTRSPSMKVPLVDVSSTSHWTVPCRPRAEQQEGSWELCGNRCYVTCYVCKRSGCRWWTRHAS